MLYVTSLVLFNENEDALVQLRTMCADAFLQEAKQGVGGSSIFFESCSFWAYSFRGVDPALFKDEKLYIFVCPMCFLWDTCAQKSWNIGILLLIVNESPSSP